MTDHEKLGLLIQDSFDEQYKERGLLTAYHTAEYLIANGVTVRQMQKPLTVEELLHLPDVLYVECSYFDEVYAALPERYDKQTIDLMMRDESCRFLLKGYGKTWRCWAEKPTEAERQAAEWEK